MVRASKTTTDSVAPTPAAAKAKTSKKVVSAAPSTAPVNEVKLTPAADAAAAPIPAVVETPSIIVKMAEFSSKLQQLAGLFVTVKSDYKTLEKAMAREMKIAAKASSKKRRNTGDRKPSGFVKPTAISTELANFLGKSVGTEMARTEVTREINKYIRANKLQDQNNGRIILADTKLRKLLKLNKDDELTYFNLQRYMSPHFAKNVKKATSQ